MGFFEGLFGGGKGTQTPQNEQQAVAGMPIQTSVYGRPIQLVFGAFRISPNLLQYENFRSFQNYTYSGGRGGGGKGFGGGGGGGQWVAGSYNYYVDFAWGLAEGPIANVNYIWTTDTVDTAANGGWSVYPGTYPQPGYWGTESYAGLGYMGRRQYFLGDGNPNTPNFNMEVLSPHAGRTNTYPGEASTGYGRIIQRMINTNSNLLDAIAAAQTAGEAINTALPTPDTDPSWVVAALLTDPYYGAGFPAENLGELITNDEQFVLQTSGTPNKTVSKAFAYAFNINVLNETTGNLMTCVAAAPGVDQYIYNATTGVYTFGTVSRGNTVRIRYASRGGLAEMQKFCIASGLHISNGYDSQTATNGMIDELCQGLYVAAVWSSGSLKFVPKGTQEVTGYGVTWTPPSEPLFSLGDDDYIQGSGPTGEANGGGGSDPVILTRSRPADQINNLKLEYLNRESYYAPAVAEVKDQAHIDTFGLRPPASLTMHFFCTANAAYTSAQLQLQDQYIRNKLSYSLDERYCVLDPMDIVALNDIDDTSLSDQWVRIVEMTENDDGTLSLICEEYPTGTGAAAAYSYQQGSGFVPDYNADPGDTNIPLVFAAPPALATNQGLEIWLALAGANLGTWGGCDVYISSDDITYRHMGRQPGATRMGVLTTNYPAGPDPDTTGFVETNWTESGAELSSGTQEDAQLGNTACLIRSAGGDEYIAYQTATMIDTNKYKLGTYIERALYGTTVEDHFVGDPIIRLDGQIFKIPYTPDQIGTTLYLKLVSFNVFGGGGQSISSVSAHEIIVPQPPRPPNVTGFAAYQQGNAVAFKWEAVDYPLIALAGYYIGYAPLGETDWSKYTMLTSAQGGDGTEMTNANVPPGQWTMGIRAASVANAPGTTNGMSPDITTVDLVVVNENNVISHEQQAPDWDGDLAGLTHDGFGRLLVLGTKVTETYCALAPPKAPTVTAVAGALALTFTGYVKITYVTPTGETFASLETSRAVTSGNVLRVTSPAAYGNATGYNVYASTTTGANTKQNNTPIPIGTSWTQTVALAAGVTVPTENTTGFEPIDVFVADPPAFAYYISNTVDAGLDSAARVYAEFSSELGPQQGGSVGDELAFYFDHWLTAESDPNDFIGPWVVGSVSLRYARSMLRYDPITAGNVEYLTGFLPYIDEVATDLIANEATIFPGGSTVPFGRTFGTLPYVVATPVSSATPLYATVSNITFSDCIVHVWDSSGNDVGGTVIWQVTGT